jgi:hypothetical protein
MTAIDQFERQVETTPEMLLTTYVQIVKKYSLFATGGASDSNSQSKRALFEALFAQVIAKDLPLLSRLLLSGLEGDSLEQRQSTHLLVSVIEKIEKITRYVLSF